MDKPVIYTIGHSTHQIEYFIELLSVASINCVVDVRSIPASRFNPQFSKAALSRALEANKISYLHFGEEFGARISNPDLLNREGQVDFEKVQRSIPFRRGIERIKQGVKNGFTIALLCAESDPLSCHRFAMISPDLEKEGFLVQHVLKDKSIITNNELKDLLILKYRKQIKKVSVSNEDELSIAMQILNKRIGYVLNETKLKSNK